MQKYQNKNKEEREAMCIWIMVWNQWFLGREKNNTYPWSVMDFIDGGGMWLESGAKICSIALPMKTQRLRLGDN